MSVSYFTFGLAGATMYRRFDWQALLKRVDTDDHG